MSQELFEENHANVVKGGESCIDFSLNRSPHGLKCVVKTHPRVEEFMRGISGGEEVAVNTVGRYWQHVVPKGDTPPPTLMAYALANKVEGYSQGEGEYTIDRLGHPLIEYPDGSSRPRVNLSFLRLVGASEAGVEFYLKGVYSKDAVTKMLEVLGTGLRRFYIDFIRPMNMSVQISTQSL